MPDRKFNKALWVNVPNIQLGIIIYNFSFCYIL